MVQAVSDKRSHNLNLLRGSNLVRYVTNCENVKSLPLKNCLNEFLCFAEQMPKSLGLTDDIVLTTTNKTSPLWIESRKELDNGVTCPQIVSCLPYQLFNSD